MDFVVHPLIGVAPRQREQIVGIDGNAPSPPRGCGSACVLDGLFGHGGRIIMDAECRMLNVTNEGSSAGTARFWSLRFLRRLTAQFQPALPGYDFSFPRDHGTHDDYKTEWWYYTGHLETDAGKRYGFELTFFRVGVVPPGSDPKNAMGSAQSLARRTLRSRTSTRNEFRYYEKLNRASPFTAGAAAGTLDVFNEGWRAVTLAGRLVAHRRLRRERRHRSGADARAKRRRSTARTASA